MKKIFINRRLIIVAFITVFTFSVTQAREGFPAPAHLEFKYIGMLQHNPLFELKFSSPGTEEDFTISVRDRQGIILYQENISGSSFSKKYLLNTDEIGDEVLRFEIISRNSGKTTWFDINPVNRFVRNWIVSSNKVE